MPDAQCAGLLLFKFRIECVNDEESAVTDGYLTHFAGELIAHAYRVIVGYTRGFEGVFQALYVNIAALCIE